MKVIAFASDHAGVALKRELIEALNGMDGYAPLDLGPASEDSVDYPDYGTKAAEAVTSGKAVMAVIICGSGIGISIAANRHKGVRAALCMNSTMARLAREHNDANVLALGARLIGSEIARDCLRAFLATPFAGGRHAGRVEKLG
jgi:ribose 5-phosphate isomerase B